MLQGLMGIIDIESFKNYMELYLEGVDSQEEIASKVASIKMLDFFKNLFNPEFNLQRIWHEDEKTQIKRKLERCVTIVQKKNYLEANLNEQEILFEEHEYFEMIEKFKDATFGEFIGGITEIRGIMKKTSRWLEASEEERGLLSLIDEIPKKLPSIDILNSLTQQKVRSIVLSKPALYALFQRFMSIKRGKTPLPKLCLDIVSDTFSIYYAIELNAFLRAEYQKLIPKSDYELAEIVEEIPKESTGRKIEVGLPRLKQRMANDNITSFSLSQTALFFNMLREHKIIFKDESYQAKENIYKAIQVLTGYNKQNIKTAMSLREYEESDKDVVQNIIKKLKT